MSNGDDTIAGLKEELDEIECTLDDEEAAHASTLRLLDLHRQALKELLDASNGVVALEWRKGPNGERWDAAIENAQRLLSSEGLTGMTTHCPMMRTQEYEALQGRRLNH